ncbi:MAG: hypothetical protein JSV34_03925 [Candidatus Omnitrophota bacterium]|nr:MAG: hypothetical protein JSV34_03925 [Candidatus Omnitrophota bacterium]
MRRKVKRILFLCGIFSILVGVSMLAGAGAADKNWTGGGDDQSWSDEDNWVPKVVPADSDDVAIDLEDASVECSATFEAQSITVGGSQTATLTVNNFVYGTVSPESSSDVALLNSKDGKVVLKGAAGTVTLSGRYKNSEEAVASEVNFMFWVE